MSDNNNSREPKDIVIFKHYSEVDKKTYSGTFKVRRISVFGVNDIQSTGNRIAYGLPISNPAHATVVQRMATCDYLITEVLEGGEWFLKDRPRETWGSIYDTGVLEALYGEVVAYDEWFRPKKVDDGDKKENQEKSHRKSEKSPDSTDRVGRKASAHESEVDGVPEVVVG